MSPKMVVSKDGVRYPRDFAEKFGIDADREIETPSAADRTHTHAGLGVTVTDDVAGSVITSAGANLGLTAPEGDPVTAEARAAEAAGKGQVGTAGAANNTTAGGTTGETTTATGTDATGTDGTDGTTSTDNGADNGGTAGDNAGPVDGDGTPVKRSAPRAGNKAGK